MQKYGTPEPARSDPEDEQGIDTEATRKLSSLYNPQEIIEEEASADREIADRD
jgi:hypothetical protein